MTDRTAEPGDDVRNVLDVVARLRGENGCPWDREQTLQSLKPFLLEEAYELLDTIDADDPPRHKDELGDVLLQVLLQSQIRKEEGAFTFEDVARHLAEKLIRRHPHVFGDVKAGTSEDVIRNWEAIKKTEKGVAAGDASVLDGLPRHLPALQRAQKVQSRASRVGFDWSRTDEVMAKVDEELRELKSAMADGDAVAVQEEIGDLLFSIVNLCRFQKIHAEEALDRTVQKFMRRFRHVEKSVEASGRRLTDCSLEELDVFWNEAKVNEARQAPPAPRA